MHAPQRSISPAALAEALVRPRRLLKPGPEPSQRLLAGGFDLALHERMPTRTPRLAALLVHGWETDHRDLVPVAEALAAQGVRCVLPDLPAHGASAGDTMMIPEAAAALQHVATAKGPFDFAVGYSMGAAILLVAMVRGLQTARVGFIAPPINYPEQLALSARGAGAPAPLVSAALDVLRKRAPDLDEIDGVAMAARMALPCTVVVAGKDDVLDPDNGRRLAAAWHGSLLLEDPEATHRSVLRSAVTLEAVGALARSA